MYRIFEYNILVFFTNNKKKTSRNIYETQLKKYVKNTA